MSKNIPGGTSHAYGLFHLILLSRESDRGAMCWTNPNPLKTCPFPSFPGCFIDFLPFNLLLVRSPKQR